MLFGEFEFTETIYFGSTGGVEAVEALPSPLLGAAVAAVAHQELSDGEDVNTAKRTGKPNHKKQLPAGRKEKPPAKDELSESENDIEGGSEGDGRTTTATGAGKSSRNMRKARPPAQDELSESEKE